MRHAVVVYQRRDDLVHVVGCDDAAPGNIGVTHQRGFVAVCEQRPNVFKQLGKHVARHDATSQRTSRRWTLHPCAHSASRPPLVRGRVST